MNRRDALKTFTTIGICALCASGGFAAEWSYEGATGPDRWGDLDAADKVCGSGSQQSPISINTSIAAELPRLRFAWTGAPDTIVNNGHTIQLSASDVGALKAGPDAWKMVQFHFHHPSEHLIDDKASAMEIHFVHRNDSGIAVVGVLVKPGRPNPAFTKIVAAMPPAEAEPVKAPANLNPLGLLPKARGYYRYSGSLTTPPCSETVEWMLLKKPLEVAARDIDAFARLYPHNARPAQLIDRRFVLRSI